MTSQYVLRIREKIGNDFLLLPSVTILVFDEDKRILLVRHHNNDLWVAPGGMIEPNETPENAAIREMKEETNCNIKLTTTIGTYGGPDFCMQYQNGDQVGYVMTVFMAEIVDGKLKPDGEEIHEIKYFSYEETKSLKTGRWLLIILKDVFEK
jgi:8-oxo-dGTP pyrophosphatase MutT (NUDIX family)